MLSRCSGQAYIMDYALIVVENLGWGNTNAVSFCLTRLLCDFCLTRFVIIIIIDNATGTPYYDVICRVAAVT